MGGVVKVCAMACMFILFFHIWVLGMEPKPGSEAAAFTH